MDNSIIPIIKELERIYDALTLKFDLKVKRPLITVQTKGREKALGWYSDERWELGSESVSEINICAEHLKDNPVETLVHEMCHYINAQEKIRDANSQGYHNGNFKTRAEVFGLKVEKMGRHGWARTTIGESLQRMLDEIKPNESTFKLYRKTSLKFTAPTKMKKFSCGCTTIRCATELEAKCLKCNNEFLIKEE